MLDDRVAESLTFDALLLVPAESSILPRDVDTSARLTKNISLNIPIISAAMDTVTESRTAICLAQEGGVGIIHRNMGIERQAIEVDKVKKSESGMIVDPITIEPEQKVHEALELMNRYRISGVPVVKNKRLVGILTNRDLRFETDLEQPVANVMTRENLVTVSSSNISLEDSKKLLHKHRIEKLLVVDDNYHLTGLITIKDIEKIKKYPLASKDPLGRLRVGAAVGIIDREERIDALLAAGADVIVIDTSHGHSAGVLDAVRDTKAHFPKCELIAGNVATAEGARALIGAGVDAVKDGVGPGSICTTRIIAGVGIPQMSAIRDAYKIGSKFNIPVIADGDTAYVTGWSGKVQRLAWLPDTGMRIERFTKSAIQIQIAFTSPFGDRTYRVETTTNPSAAGWTTLAGAFIWRTGEGTYAGLCPVTGSATQFYRIGVRP